MIKYTGGERRYMLRDLSTKTQVNGRNWELMSGFSADAGIGNTVLAELRQR